MAREIRNRFNLYHIMYNESDTPGQDEYIYVAALTQIIATELAIYNGAENIKAVELVSKDCFVQ